MIKLNETADSFTSQFERLEAAHGSNGAQWFLPTRKAAFARFTELGFPTSKNEDWRFTNVAVFAKTTFADADELSQDVCADDLKTYRTGEDNGQCLVLVNGRYRSDLSDTTNLPSGVTVMDLAEVMADDASQVDPFLAKLADYQDEPFTALNTALMRGGAFIHVSKGVVVSKPIELLHVCTVAQDPVAVHPRSLIVVEQNSQLTVVEIYAGLSDNAYLTNTVTEIVANENAIVDHYKVVREGSSCSHISTLDILQLANSNVSSHAISLDGKLIRNSMNVVLGGEGGHCTLNGVYFTNDGQHVGNHLTVDHAKPNCNSWEYFKGVLSGASRGVFRGRIIVRKDAQKTDAKQTNMSLLLSDLAHIESKPQLEIFADDVKCTHGATIGQLDEEAIFYLRARGIDEQTARSMLVYAFARESIEQIKVPSLQKQLLGLFFARLPQGNLLQKAI